MTAEALIIIPLLLLISIAIVEFGLLLSLRQSVAHAAIEGAREASKGVTTADLNGIVETALGGFDVALATNAGYLFEDPANLVFAQVGAITCDQPSTPLTLGNVRMTVCVNSSGSPVSGLIAKFGGANLLDKIMSATAVAKTECP
ncbi:MAG: pilus assembly protein [Planctomycetales bacterium]|nr:pilus assembly protein [Planctomycetales bacterium]